MMRAVQGAGGAGVAAAAPVGTEAEGEADAAAAPSSSAGTVAVVGMYGVEFPCIVHAASKAGDDVQCLA
jgi:hypothetical protein